MPIPDYQSVMLPLLRLAEDGLDHRFRESVKVLAAQFHMTPADLEELLPSGTQPVFVNRVGWARTYLVKAGLLHSPRRGYFRITDIGRDVLASSPSHIDAAFLKANFPEFLGFVTPQPAVDEPMATGAPSNVSSLTETPEESLEISYQSLRRTVESEILARLHAGSAPFFEHAVVRLLVAMGYGGTLRDAGKAIGGSGDAGTSELPEPQSTR